jgi:hypothetical protein
LGIGQRDESSDHQPKGPGKEKEKESFWAKRNETFADLRLRYVITHTRDRLAIKIEEEEEEEVLLVCVMMERAAKEKRRSSRSISSSPGQARPQGALGRPVAFIVS